MCIIKYAADTPKTPKEILSHLKFFAVLFFNFETKMSAFMSGCTNWTIVQSKDINWLVE